MNKVVAEMGSVSKFLLLEQKSSIIKFEQWFSVDFGLDMGILSIKQARQCVLI